MKTSMRIGSAIALALLGNAAAAAEAVTGENEQVPVTVYGKLNLQYEVRKAPLDDGSKYPPAKPGALEYVSRSKRLNRGANATLALGDTYKASASFPKI